MSSSSSRSSSSSSIIVVIVVVVAWCVYGWFGSVGYPLSVRPYIGSRHQHSSSSSSFFISAICNHSHHHHHHIHHVHSQSHSSSSSYNRTVIPVCSHLAFMDLEERLARLLDMSSSSHCRDFLAEADRERPPAIGARPRKRKPTDCLEDEALKQLCSDETGI